MPARREIEALQAELSRRHPDLRFEPRVRRRSGLAIQGLVKASEALADCHRAERRRQSPSL
jgi:hypothetical protein